MKKYPPREHNKWNRVSHRDFPRFTLHGARNPFDDIKPIIRTRQSESKPSIVR